MPGLGKLIRLGRIVDPASGTAIVLPLDHPVESASLVELEQPREIVRCLAGSGINAFLMRRGLARHTVRDFAGQAGWIQRMTGRSGLSTAGDAHRDAHQLVIASVEDAARNGADAVAPTSSSGGIPKTTPIPNWDASLTNAPDMISPCLRNSSLWGGQTPPP